MSPNVIAFQFFIFLRRRVMYYCYFFILWNKRQQYLELSKSVFSNWPEYDETKSCTKWSTQDTQKNQWVLIEQSSKNSLIMFQILHYD